MWHLGTQPILLLVGYDDWTPMDPAWNVDGMKLRIYISVMDLTQIPNTIIVGRAYISQIAVKFETNFMECMIKASSHIMKSSFVDNMST